MDPGERVRDGKQVTKQYVAQEEIDHEGYRQRICEALKLAVDQLNLWCYARYDSCENRPKHALRDCDDFSDFDWFVHQILAFALLKETQLHPVQWFDKKVYITDGRSTDREHNYNVEDSNRHYPEDRWIGEQGMQYVSDCPS